KENCGTQRGIAGVYSLAVEYVGAAQSNRAQATIAVDQGGLVEATGGDNWVICRTDTAEHPVGTAATPATLRALVQLANRFSDVQAAHNAELATAGQAPWPVVALAVNDISLPQGGLFDVVGFDVNLQQVMGSP